MTRAVHNAELPYCSEIELADEIRARVAELNAAVRLAAQRGVRVTLDVASSVREIGDNAAWPRLAATIEKVSPL